ncbi:MAG TPA: HEAT repeat domain-containing protein, partial [Thermoanaerobaculia bacterium]|nr:HEAT repeat domain-containing protein [Thermoanaerobaculia bacterium]
IRAPILRRSRMWSLFALCVIGYGIWAAMQSQSMQSRPVLIPSRERLQGWKDVVEGCGLQVTESTAALSPQLTARAGQVEVRIAVAFGTGGQGTRIVVKAPVAQDFEKVRIHPQSIPYQSIPQVEEVQVADLDFHSTFCVEGPRPQVFALLDAATRQRLRRVNAAGRVEISPGQILAVVSGAVSVSDVLSSLLAIRERLGAPIDVRQSLVENVKRDPDSRVRLANLLLLLREFPGDPVTAEALRAACSDRLPEIRLRAAKMLGEAERREALLELAHNLEEDAWSAEAVSALNRELPVERAKAILDRAWTTGRFQTALACVEVLGRSGAAAVEPLADVLALHYAELATAAVRALEATGSPDAEPSLIQALQHHKADVRVATANALRRAGSAAAVLPLKEASERFPLDLELRRATRQAIAEIQSRVEGASPGQLSLAATEAGQLSLANDPAGQLSISDDNPGAAPGTASSPGAEWKNELSSEEAR